MTVEPATAEMAHLRLCPDAVLRIVDGVWIATNPRTRSHVELDATAVAALADHASGGPVSAWNDALAAAHGYDRSGFDFTYGLCSDPSRLVGRHGRAETGDELVSLLHRQWILCSIDGDDYRHFLARLDSILDRDHLGSFHERIGQHLAIVLRVRDKWRWWHESKFAPEGTALRPGPYKWIQETFFDRYFATQAVAGTRVLDFACGNGFYSRKFAALGATVLGIDTDANLIRHAEAQVGGDCRFVAPANPTESLAYLGSLQPGSYDRVYMSDIFLLLGDTDATTGAAPTMAALARLLRPGGRLHMCEPNPIFWLGCRLGDNAAPMVVVSEYRRPIYNVAPTLDRVMAPMGRAGFALIEFLHPDGAAIPPNAAQLAAFARDFPLWDFLTFERLPL